MKVPGTAFRHTLINQFQETRFGLGPEFETRMCRRRVVFAVRFNSNWIVVDSENNVMPCLSRSFREASTTRKKVYDIDARRRGAARARRRYNDRFAPRGRESKARFKSSCSCLCACTGISIRRSGGFPF